MARIVITEFMDEAAIAPMRARHDVVYDPALVDRPDDLVASMADADALIVRNRTQVRGTLLDAAARLVCVGRLGVGLDNIDVDACRARKIDVYPAAGANNLSVAEYVITASLMLLRGAWLSSAAVAAGEWPRQRMMGRETAGKVMGLVGLGAIAREVVWRAGELGMQVIAHDPHLMADDRAWQVVRNVSLDGLFETADVVSLHVPLTETTRGMASRERIDRMKPGAVLINASRGGTVDEQALVDALRSGKLGGAALDVFDDEPLTAAAGQKFVGVPNLILTPHIAGVTEESNVRVSRMIADVVLSRLERT